MSKRKSNTQIGIEARAEKSFAKMAVHDQLGKHAVSLEDKRVASDAAKTAKLRALRQARDAAGSTDATAAKAEPGKGGK